MGAKLRVTHKVTNTRISILKTCFNLIFSLLTSVAFYAYQGLNFSNCKSVLLGYRGDLTSGEVWVNWLFTSNEISFNSFYNFETHAVNYPDGEKISTIYFFGQISRRFLAIVLSELFGPICSINIFIMIGLFLTSFFTLQLLNQLNNLKYLNLILAISFSFSTFTVSKILDHPQYSHLWFLPVIILILINKNEKSYKVKVIKIIIILIISITWDMYTFVLTVFSLVTYMIASATRNKRKFYTIFLIIVPILYFYLNKISPLTEIFSIRAPSELFTYRLKLIYFLSPYYSSTKNSYFKNDGLLSSDTIGHEANFFALPLILVLILQIIYLARKKLITKTDIKLDEIGRVILRLFLYAAVLNFVLIPIVLKVFIIYDLQIDFPIRVISRFGVSLIFYLVLIISITSNLIISQNKTERLIRISSNLILIVGVIYNTYMHLPRIDFMSMPKIYSEIGQYIDKESVLASYPIQSQDTTFQLEQTIHGFKLVNPTFFGVTNPLENALALGDPMSIPTLKRLGVTHLLVRANLNEMDYVKKIEQFFGPNIIKSQDFKFGLESHLAERIYLIRLPESKKADYFVNYGRGFSNPITGLYAGRWTYSPESELMISAFKKTDFSRKIRVELYATTHVEPNLVTISQGAKILWKGKVFTEPQKIFFDASIKEPVIIITGKRESLQGISDKNLYGIFLSSINVREIK